MSSRAFKIFKVSVNFTVKMVIEQTLKKSGDDCEGWAATEAVERGDGQWEKVSGIRSITRYLKLMPFVGHHNRVRQRQSKRNSEEYGLDSQARRCLAASLVGRA